MYVTRRAGFINFSVYLKFLFQARSKNVTFISVRRAKYIFLYDPEVFNLNLTIQQNFTTTIIYILHRISAIK